MQSGSHISDQAPASDLVPEDSPLWGVYCPMLSCLPGSAGLSDNSSFVLWLKEGWRGASCLSRNAALDSSRDSSPLGPTQPSPPKEKSFHCEVETKREERERQRDKEDHHHHYHPSQIISSNRHHSSHINHQSVVTNHEPSSLIDY